MAKMNVMPQFGNFSTTSLQIVNPRLTEENYRYWKAQALVIVSAYGLEDHLTGLVQFLLLSFLHKVILKLA